MRVSTSRFKTLLLGALIVLLLLPVGGLARAQKATVPTVDKPQESPALRKIADSIAERENQLVVNLQRFSPRLETYMQEFGADPDLTTAPTDDGYFLGRLAQDKTRATVSFIEQPSSGFVRSFFGLVAKVPKSLSSLGSSRPYYLERFALDAVIDPGEFDRTHYEFQFVRTEFLGDVRCLVFDVRPLDESRGGRFKGRIWVESFEYNVVRYNGIRVNPEKGSRYFHIDGWRQNLQPGIWLPAYIYSEETQLPRHRLFKLRTRHITFRAQTRFWGYNAPHQERDDELTKILVESPTPVQDNADAVRQSTPLGSQRSWENEAEENVLDRLQKAGLIAPPGEVDKILETVVNNLIVTNQLENLPPVHCRVMLTAPFESFSVGNTIVLSRGLIDVLADEPMLATMIAHELGHVVLGHMLDTKYGFNDRLLMPDSGVISEMNFSHDPEQERAADAKGLELLKNSPYKDKLGNAGLFLRALANERGHLPHLLGAHLGDRLEGASGENALRMADLMEGAPQLQPRKLDQIAALPLGSRLLLDPWSAQISLVKAQAPAPLTPREKMPFQLTFLPPYLTYFDAPPDEIPVQGGPTVAKPDGQ